ncbi:MAG: hypothetical protein RBU23_03455 [Candidatus Auribacterota bacterium]|jgi:hypothetical protein|nr:hypothetical protein [Candidatus Auribacterota bacterium]
MPWFKLLIYFSLILYLCFYAVNGSYSATYFYNEDFDSPLNIEEWSIEPNAGVANHNLATESSYLRVTSLNRAGSEPYIHLTTVYNLPYEMETFTCEAKIRWNEYASNTGFGLQIQLSGDNGFYVKAGIQDWWYHQGVSEPPKMYGNISNGTYGPYHATSTGSINSSATLKFSRDETGYTSIYWNDVKLLAYLDSDMTPVNNITFFLVIITIIQVT